MATTYTSRPTINFDSPEPTVTADRNASALFPSQPVYARTPKKKTGDNLPLMVGAPVLALVAGGLVWMAMSDRAETPTDPQSLQAAASQSQPAARTAPIETPAAPIPQPTEIAANEIASSAPAPVARPVATRALIPARAPARSTIVAPTEVSPPSVSTASSDVSATVSPTTPTVNAPAIAEPAPLVIPAAPAPQTTTPQTTDPVNPM
jgi:hypothetical protein